MKQLKNVKISSKIVGSFMIVIILFIVNTGISFYSIQQVSGNFKEFYDEQYQVMKQAEAYMTSLQGLGKSISRMAIASDAQLQSETGSSVEEQKKVADEFYEEMQASIAALSEYDSVSKDDMNTLQQATNTLKGSYGSMYNYYLQGATQQGIQVFDEQYYQTALSAMNAGESLTQQAEDAAVDAHQENTNLVRRLFIESIVIGLILIGVAIVICIQLSRSIVKPLKELGKSANLMTAGNLHFNLEYSAENEFGRLAEDFRESRDSLSTYITEIDRRMVAIGGGDLSYEQTIQFRGEFRSIEESMDHIQSSLAQIMTQINASADQVVNGARQIAESGQDLSQATVEQASSVEELAATINEVSEKIQDNAENAMKSSQKAEAASLEVQEAGKKIMHLSETMNDMKELSKEITGIMKDIEDIAFQTNILSLNAAVEAARAGDAGKGFSVVANEIRQLAAKTSEASKSTSRLMGKTVSMMGEGSELAQKTTDEFRTMSQLVKESADIVDKISRASNEQANAIVQIRQSIEMITVIVQQNSATAEESAASSEELTGQMQMLKELVEIFKY